MEQCPAEICHMIFSYACVDGGFTGRSLSLVSKFFHEASQTTRLQSVAAVGYEKLLALADTLENTDPQLRRVQYVFISAQSRNTASEPKALIPEYTRRLDAYVAFTRILLAISSTIEILHAVFIFCRPFPLLPTNLPFLRELTIHGPVELSRDGVVNVQLPSLRHLHFSPASSPTYLCNQIVRPLTPSLIHLRIPVPEHSHTTFLTELESVLEYNVQLQRIYIHCPNEPKDNWMDRHVLYERAMEGLNTLKRNFRQLTLLPPLPLGMFRTISIQDAESAWTNSVLGDEWW